MYLKRLFYAVKPLVPRRTQIAIRRQQVFRKRTKHTDIWPINFNSGKKPENWKGWPEDKKFAFVLTHDVETERGQRKCKVLAEIEQSYGFRSSFNFVPERYKDDPELRTYLQEHQFEVGVHGLNHDGKLYASKKTFLKRAEKINAYLEAWGAVGFRSPAMHHNLDWLRNLNILYDASTFDTDPFEPQPDGVNRIFPFYVPPKDGLNGYVELPYTLPQDFTLFVLMEEPNTLVWQKKLDWIVSRGGMALLNVHPDYIDFGSEKEAIDTYDISLYTDILDYIKTNYEGQYWHAQPREVAQFYMDQYVLEKNEPTMQPVSL